MRKVVLIMSELCNIENIVKCLNLRSMKGLHILMYIKSQPNCNVKQIMQDLNIDQVTVSVVLNLMKRMNIVDSKVQWYNRIYEITDPVVDKILTIFIENK